MSKQRSFLNLRGVQRGQPPEPARILIDGYRVGELIGAGTMTAAYHAVLESHQQEVVVKVLLPGLAASEVLVQRFLQAANAARRVTHDRVLPCYDVGQSNGWVYLASELIEGGDLAGAMRDGPLDRMRAVYLAWQMAMGLEAVHGAGLVHGNLRPSNVLVDNEDGVRLADCGLPGFPEPEAPGGEASSAELHLPPEAVLGDGSTGPRGDIYAVGVVLIGCLLGRTPWQGDTRQDLAAHHAAGQQVMDELSAERLDPDLAAVLARATASRPEERYAETWHLREDLERLQYQFAPIHARPVEPAMAVPAAGTASTRQTRLHQRTARSDGPATPSGRRALILGLAGAVALLVAIIVVVAIASGPATTPPPAAAPPADPAPAAAAAPAVAPAPPPAEPAGPAWAAAAGVDATGRWCELVVDGARQRLRLVPAGSFWMGSAAVEAERAADEDRHLVTLTRPFWIGDTEVTQAFYRAVAGQAPAHFAAPDRPMESVSWNAVQDFLARLGSRTGAPVRLPTEAEWEYACRAGTDLPPVPGTDRAWTASSGIEGTRPVGRLKPNPFGLFDMQGNVLEWVEDTYGRYPREAVTDPMATGGVHRVTRGGAWNLDPAAARPSGRSKALPVAAFFYLGFRIAITG